VVNGAGFRFEAPAGWDVASIRHGQAAFNGTVDRLEVLTFPLVTPYREELFVRASRELNGVARQLADQLEGRVASSRTVRVAGRKARSYRIDYGKRMQRITFLLVGRREYQLLCRRPAGADDEVCTALLKTFRLD
jgi:hypothetical protein